MVDPIELVLQHRLDQQKRLGGGSGLQALRRRLHFLGQAIGHPLLPARVESSRCADAQRSTRAGAEGKFVAAGLLPRGAAGG